MKQNIFTNLIFFLHYFSDHEKLNLKKKIYWKNLNFETTSILRINRWGREVVQLRFF